ncbi:protein Son [Anopheles darlingi]|uniref:protein Son n=1 Tax=Anopheles darlingi TaxID=43151 RepID=UPI0021001664|nr:protein Son [Anopheles darlingi]
MSATAEKDPKQKGDKPKELFPLNIKIKQEKTTSYEDSSKSETVDKLSIDVNLTNIFSTTITSSGGGAATEKGSDTVDVKPSLEPLKSSNEILTELFRVFNAAPPEIAMIEDDSNEATELEKKKKKHKHKKKSKKRKENLSDEGELAEEGEGKSEGHGPDPTSDEGEPTRVKKKKIKKDKDRDRKHKRKRHREETLLVTIKQEPVDDYEKPGKDHHHHGKHGKDKREEKEESSVKEKVEKVEKVEESRPLMKGKIQIKSLKNSSIFKELAKSGSSDTKHEHERQRHEDDRDRERSSYRGERSEMRKRHRSDSDFSLSDDEKNRGQKRYYDFYQKKYNSFYASYEEENERNKHERKRHKRSEDRDRDHRDRRHRSSGSHSSRSRSRSPEQFDKQKLLEIAQKNAISMIKKGTLPGVQNLDGESKTKLISMVRTSGKSVEELTEYCKKLSHKDNSNDLSSVSSDESDHDADGGSKAFHHPFQLKEQAPIVMNIRNATALQPKSAEEKKALLMQFPVSSGIPHRATENEWIPVEPKKAPPPGKAQPPFATPGNKPKLPKNILPPSANFVPQQSQPTVTMEYGILAPGQLPTATSSATITQQNPAPLVGPGAAMNAGVPQATSAVLGPMFENAQVYPAAHVAPVNQQLQQQHPTPFGNRPQPDPSLALPVDTSIPPPIIPSPLIASRPTDNQHMGPRPDHPHMGPRPDHPHMGPRLDHPHMGPRPDHPHAGPRADHSQPYPPVRHTGGPSGSAAPNGPTNVNVFKPPSEGQQLDVAQIVSQRLNAMRKLQENPTDPDARQLLYNTQKDMSVWASSKVMPGQFLGSTGVNCLSQRELAEGYQPWARRDMMKQSAPVTGGMGMHLLQKMGWQPGEGLGKEKNGSLHPLLLDVKLDKRGLGEGEDKHRNMPFQAPLFSRRGDNRSRFPPNQVKVCTEGKHPVSILGEYASKRKWNAPMYELVHESGPGHAKNFIFKVLVNGLEYQPAISNNTKKEAKATAAKFCLQQLGVAIT